MQRASPARTWLARIGAALASTSASVLVAWLLWPTRADTVLQVVDHSRELDALLASRLELPRALNLPGAGLRVAREPLDAQTTRLFFPHSLSAEHESDPHALFRWQPSQSRRVPFPELPTGSYLFTTDAHALRRATGSKCAPGGVLVIGDSHTDGLVDAEQSFCTRLEQALRSTGASTWPEVWNTGVVGYCPYNYLGVLEARAELRPAVAVVVLYGGNDFMECMPLWRWNERRAPRSGPAREWDRRKLGLVPRQHGALAQHFAQVLYFAGDAEEEARAAELMRAVAHDLRELASRAGAKLLCAYLPPPPVGQPRAFAAATEELRASFGLPRAALEVCERLAAAWLDELAELGVATLDLRGALRAEDEPCYYALDWHLNGPGHALVARELRPRVESLLR